MSGLLHCPFCGRIPNTEQRRNGRGHVWCSNPECGANPVSDGDDLAGATFEWNRRLVTEPETLGPSASFWSNVRTEPEAQPPGDGFQLSSEAGHALQELEGLLTVLEDERIPPEEIIEAYERADYIKHFRILVAALSRKERESAASPVQPSHAGEGEADIRRALLGMTTLFEDNAGDINAPEYQAAMKVLRTNPEGEG